VSHRTPLAEFLPPVPDPDFPPGRVALLLVDLQHGDAHPDFGLGRRARAQGQFGAMADYYARVTAMLPHVQRLLDGFRGAGQAVVHVRLGTTDPEQRDVNRGLRLRGTVPLLGTREAAFLPEVAPQAGELVFEKTTMSAFNSSRLRETLYRMGIETLVVAGVVTNGCVEMTARDAADHDFSVVVVSDACTAGTPELHANALDRMATSAVGLISVLCTEEVLAQVSRRTVPALPD